MHAAMVDSDIVKDLCLTDQKDTVMFDCNPDLNDNRREKDRNGSLAEGFVVNNDGERFRRPTLTSSF
jgi:hypothetical protein